MTFTAEKPTMLSQLRNKKKFHVLCADFTLEQAGKNTAYVLKAELPVEWEFLEVVQIASPASVISPLLANSQVAYCFLVPADEPLLETVYITSLFSEVPFPWSTSSMYLDYSTPRVQCFRMGITTHSGVPIMHAGVRLEYGGKYRERYVDFEKELVEAGYQVIGTKPYGAAASLVEMYKSSPSPVEPG